MNQKLSLRGARRETHARLVLRKQARTCCIRSRSRGREDLVSRVMVPKWRVKALAEEHKSSEDSPDEEETAAVVRESENEEAASQHQQKLLVHSLKRGEPCTFDRNLIIAKEHERRLVSKSRGGSENQQEEGKTSRFY